MTFIEQKVVFVFPVPAQGNSLHYLSYFDTSLFRVSVHMAKGMKKYCKVCIPGDRTFLASICQNLSTNQFRRGSSDSAYVVCSVR